MSKPIFYAGQAVGCLMFGEGVIVEVHDSYPMLVHFITGKKWSYTLDGRYIELANPTLYPIEQYREIIANLPKPEPEKWKPNPGEWCLFSSESYKKSAWTLARYAQEATNGYMAKINGGLSTYDYCIPFTGELPKHLKGGAE